MRTLRQMIIQSNFCLCEVQDFDCEYSKSLPPAKFCSISYNEYERGKGEVLKTPQTFGMDLCMIVCELSPYSPGQQCRSLLSHIR